MVGRIFASTRQIIWFAFFVLWIVLDVVELGLVSQQIHKHGRLTANWPTLIYYHAMGLLLFSGIVGLLFGMFFWYMGLPILMFLFLCFGVWYGTAAGIFHNTPFGHGYGSQCSNAASSFPTNYQPFLSDCTRVEAIEAFAWTMFGLSVIGLFYAFHDGYSLTKKRNDVFDNLIVEKEKHAKVVDEEAATH
ncbi:hypothetical protein P7C73_g6061, partial [Tremellales sp. Uapishka_1]